MTITTYHATHGLGRSHAEANSLVHTINDMTAGNGDNRSWDAVRAHVDALADSATQQRLQISIEAEKHDSAHED